MTKKYTSKMNCGTYQCRMTPFFDTVQECEAYIVANNVNDTDCYIHPVSNWQEVINGRNSYNTDDSVPQGM